MYIQRAVINYLLLGQFGKYNVHIELHSFDSESSKLPFALHVLLPNKWVEAICGNQIMLPKGGEQRGRVWYVPCLTHCHHTTL